MNDKKWCFRLLAALLAATFALAGLNVLVDPFGVFGDPLYQWYDYGFTNNPRVAKIAYLDRHHDEYDSYIIGGSSTSSYPTEDLNRYFGGRFYNMLMYGSKMSDVEKTCFYVVENYHPKRVVVNLYPTLALYGDDVNDALTGTLHAKVGGRPLVPFYLKYAFANPQYAFDKLKNAAQDTYLPQVFDVFIPETGTYNKTARDAEPIGVLADYEHAYPVFTDYPTSPLPLKHVEEVADGLRRIIALCAEQSVELHFVMAPVYYDCLMRFPEADIRAFYTAIAEVTPFWDFSISSASREPRYFYDATHFRNALGHMALARMFDDGYVYVPPDFGVYVTKDTVASRLDALWNVAYEPSAYTAEIPVLMYHSIAANDVEDGEAGTPPLRASQFEAQIKALADNGYQSVSAEDMIAYVEHGSALPSKPVCITFDDGYRNNYELAYPILKKYGMQATVFAIGVSIGRNRYKDTDFPITPHYGAGEMREMSDSGIIVTQSHTYDMHQWAPYESGENLRENILRLAAESEREYIDCLTVDFLRSKEVIEDITGKEVNALAFPGGLSDTLSQAVLSALGVKVTFGVAPGVNTLVKGLPQSLYALHRFSVTGKTDPADLLALLEK